MNVLKQIDCSKCINLLIGIAGINLTFIVCGILYEWITKIPYNNS